MELNKFKIKIDNLIEQYLDNQIEYYTKLYKNKRISATLEYYKTFILSGGKRIRPYMFYLFFKMNGGKFTKKHWNMAMSFELLHNALLIHDDILDKGKTRHGIDCFHIYLNNKVYDQKQDMGAGQALLAADLLFGLSISLFVSNINKTPASLEIIHMFLRMFELVNYGQIIDFDFSYGDKISKKDIDKKNHLKTSTYSFTFPMLIGFCLANGRYVDNKILTKIGNHLGNAFQIKDDLNDVILEHDNKTLFSDIQAGQQNYVSNFLFDNLKGNDLKTFRRSFGKQLSNSQIVDLKNIIVKSELTNNLKDDIHKNVSKVKKLKKTLKIKEIKYMKYFDQILNKISGVKVNV